MTKNWYIIHTYSGFEKKVAETLRSRVEAAGLKERFGEIMVRVRTSSNCGRAGRW